ncbi:hypothetical protein MU580_00805 [Clavibacter michiganensis subsp. michiganensis]|uniref:hypothetical protein n=1 Tax=Clavibacter michiganensis TaxID=28447 RepID=UPI001FF46E6B|nr:hypothetical protein [Clavibacter michiganensis]UOW03844.1 hypothetical protein MU580_00805 [Clavibacter michiganensis subsp. michiganensis]
MTDDRTPDPDAPHALEQHGREPDDRRGELIAAALADDLSPAETAELDAMRAADPTIDEEIALLGGLPAALGGLGSWQEAEPSDELARRVGLIADGRGEVEPMAATTATTAADGPADLDAHRARRGSGPRRTAFLIAGAAACIAVGVAGGAFLATPRADVARGPAGTLGAVEDVTFAGAPAGVDVEGDVVAHTWGTETLLTVDGLTAGDSYSVVVVDAAGGEHSSGTMLGSAVRIDCRLNADVLRRDAASVEIRDAAGDRVAVAELPPVDA